MPVRRLLAGFRPAGEPRQGWRDSSAGSARVPRRVRAPSPPRRRFPPAAVRCPGHEARRLRQSMLASMNDRLLRVLRTINARVAASRRVTRKNGGQASRHAASRIGMPPLCVKRDCAASRDAGAAGGYRSGYCGAHMTTPSCTQPIAATVRQRLLRDREAVIHRGGRRRVVEEVVHGQQSAGRLPTDRWRDRECVALEGQAAELRRTFGHTRRIGGRRVQIWPLGGIP